jgi:hypothetical protein
MNPRDEYLAYLASGVREIEELLPTWRAAVQGGRHDEAGKLHERIALAAAWVQSSARRFDESVGTSVDKQPPDIIRSWEVIHERLRNATEHTAMDFLRRDPDSIISALKSEQAKLVSPRTAARPGVALPNTGAQATTPNESWVLLDPAFQSKRLELVRVAASVESMLPTLVELWQKEPQSGFKDEVLLIILESRWPSDPSGPPPAVPFRLWAPVMEWACIDALASRMPDHALSVEDFATLASRKNVAANFREVLERGGKSTADAATPGRARESRNSGSVKSVAMPARTANGSQGEIPPGANASSGPRDEDAHGCDVSHVKSTRMGTPSSAFLSLLYVGVGIVAIIVVCCVLVRALAR